MISDLQIGVVLTVLAYLGLVAVVVHAKYVIEKIGDGEYDKGPFRDSEENA